MSAALPARVGLAAPEDVLSFYLRGERRIPLSQLRHGRLTPDASAALERLARRVREDGGQLLVTDAHRPSDVQGRNRARYERWLRAGKPSPGSSDYDPKTMKAAFVARPGRSFHSAARAIDFAHMLAAPPDIPKERALDWMWERARPLGWRPVIRAPIEGASEAWHLDYPGPWSAVLDELGYEQAAMAATLDIGDGADLFARPWQRWVQAQLWRAGAAIGDIDGWWGPKTAAGASVLGLALPSGDGTNDEFAEALIRLPSCDPPGRAGRA